MNVYVIIIFFVTYLICSINPAIEICKRKTGEDIRKLGSGNAGTANAMRVLGRVLGTIVVMLDILKVLLSFKIVGFLMDILNYENIFVIQSVFIIAVVIGHCYPIYYKFKGGKGVIVGITAAFLLNSQIAIVCIVAGVLILLLTRIVSVGTLGGLALYLIMSIVMMPQYLVAVIISSLIVAFKHRANIQRIVNKQENKLW